MNKDNLSKIIKIVILSLFAVGFFMPFVIGSIQSIGNYSYSVFELEQLNADKSADLIIIFYFMITIFAIAFMLLKPKYESVTNIITLIIGLLVLFVIYLQVFNDRDLKLAIEVGQMTARVGFGIIFQLLIFMIGILFEFFGIKIFTTK